MIERPHAFGEQEYSLLDNVIYALRKRQVVRHLPTLHQETVLDLGAGYDARLLIDLMSENPDIQGIGVDMAFAPQLQNQSRFTAVVADLDRALNIEDMSVDICVSLAVIEHLHHPQEFLNEIFRIVKRGGMVYLTTPGPTAKPVLEFMAFKLGIIDAAEISDHKNYFSSAQLRAMFTEAGFMPTNISCQTFIFGMNNLVIARKL